MVSLTLSRAEPRDTGFILRWPWRKLDRGVLPKECGIRWLRLSAGSRRIAKGMCVCRHWLEITYCRSWRIEPLSKIGQCNDTDRSVVLHDPSRGLFPIEITRVHSLECRADSHNPGISYSLLMSFDIMLPWHFRLQVMQFLLMLVMESWQRLEAEDLLKHCAGQVLWQCLKSREVDYEQVPRHLERISRKNGPSIGSHWQPAFDRKRLGDRQRPPEPDDCCSEGQRPNTAASSNLFAGEWISFGDTSATSKCLPSWITEAPFYNSRKRDHCCHGAVHWVKTGHQSTKRKALLWYGRLGNNLWNGDDYDNLQWEAYTDVE